MSKRVMKSKRVGKWTIRLLKLGHIFGMEISTKKYRTPFVATGKYLKRPRFKTCNEAKVFYDSLNTLRQIFLFGLSCAGKMAYSDYAMYGGRDIKLPKRRRAKKGRRKKVTFKASGGKTVTFYSRR